MYWSSDEGPKYGWKLLCLCTSKASLELHNFYRFCMSLTYPFYYSTYAYMSSTIPFWMLMCTHKSRGERERWCIIKYIYIYTIVLWLANIMVLRCSTRAISLYTSASISSFILLQFDKDLKCPSPFHWGHVWHSRIWETLTCFYLAVQERARTPCPNLHHIETYPSCSMFHYVW